MQESLKWLWPWPLRLCVVLIYYVHSAVNYIFNLISLDLINHNATERKISCSTNSQQKIVIPIWRFQVDLEVTLNPILKVKVEDTVEYLFLYLLSFRKITSSNVIRRSRYFFLVLYSRPNEAFNRV